MVDRGRNIHKSWLQDASKIKIQFLLHLSRFSYRIIDKIFEQELRATKIGEDETGKNDR